MATSTLADVALTGSWVDLTVTLASLVSADATIQNVGPGAIAVVYGGVTAPSGKSGLIRRPGETVTGNAANVWARSLESAGAVSVTLS